MRIGDDDAANPASGGGVARLQRQLRSFRYGFIVDPPGRFDLTTSWAVREFQIDANSPCVGQEVGTASAYGDRLVGIPNSARTPLPITGIVDDETARLLDEWERNGYRCPVVARLRDRSTRALLQDDVWFLPSDLGPTPPKNQRLWIKDVSGRYDLPPDRLVDGEVVAGRPLGNAPYAGWTCDRIDSWGSGHEVSIEALTGAPIGDTSAPSEAARRSTYRVVRAVAEVENMGRFDVVNAYDSAVLSLGVMHAALYLGPGSAGELQALWAYARDAPDGEAEYERYVGGFGIRTEHDWPADGASISGNRLSFFGQRKWATKAMQRGLRVAGVVQLDWTPLIDPLDAEYFRHSHWFWRLVMMGRAYEPLRAAQWDLARLRLRELLASPLEAGSAATIGSAFSSERAVTALFRAHVNSPAKVIRSGMASSLVRDTATLPAVQRDEALVAALTNALPRSSMPTALQFNDPTTGPLSAAPGSFVLDTTGLDRPGGSMRAPSSRKLVSLHGSVGVGGINRPSDVSAIRRRLVQLGVDWLAPDGAADDELAAAIRLLQSMVAGRTELGGDGRVDPDGKILPWLNSADAPRWQPLPAGSVEHGFLTLAPDEAKWASSWLVATIEGAGRTYRAEYAASRSVAAVITVTGAAARRPSGTGGLATGLACELLMPGDRGELTAIVSALRSQPHFRELWLDDVELVTCGWAVAKPGYVGRARLVVGPPLQR